MSFITDIRTVSEGALNQLASRFADLPRPLLAAIGAGDMAVERLAELRESLSGSIHTPDLDDLTGGAKEFAGDLPTKAQKAFAEVTESVEKFAEQAPARTRELVAELPTKFAELRESLGQDQIKEAVEGYTQLAAMLYGSLADRGDKTWSKVVHAAGVDTTVVDAPPEKDGPAGDTAADEKAADETAVDEAPAGEATAADSASNDAPTEDVVVNTESDTASAAGEATSAAADDDAAEPEIVIAAKPTPGEEAAAIEAITPPRKSTRRSTPSPKPATRVMAAPATEPEITVHPILDDEA